MLRLISCIIMVLAFESCLSSDDRSAGRAKTMDADLAGVYELVSNRIISAKPERVIEEHSPDDWLGIWFFQQGHYSQSEMYKKRGWPPFPHNQKELGYESSAGEYQVDKNVLTLKPSVSVNPLGTLNPKTLEYRIEGDSLTL